MISQMIGREPVKIVCKRTPRNNWAVQRADGDYECDVCFTIYHAPISVHLKWQQWNVNQIFTAAPFNVKEGLFILMITILHDLQINTFLLRMQIEFLKLSKVVLIRRS